MAKAPGERFPDCRSLISAARQALTKTPRAPDASEPRSPTPGTPEPHPPVLEAPEREGSPAAATASPPVHTPQHPSESARWPAPAAALEGYLPLRRPARRVRIALWLSILLALASAVANLDDTAWARQLAGDGAASGDLYLWVGALQATWFLVTAGLWLAWFRRAYLNLPALGARRLRYRPWWAVGAWLLPVFSLFRPK